MSDKERIEKIKHVFNETIKENSSFDEFGWPENIGWLIDTCEKYREALEQIANSDGWLCTFWESYERCVETARKELESDEN